MESPGPTESDAQIYRGRAEQARLAAQAAVDPRDCRMFQALAQSYEQLARDAEWLQGHCPRVS